ncbi:MAG: hypothetical protein Q4C01_02090 [Clostridia bacterium]|nr:hypothetical protein [Clostridia bacterium]
MGVYTTAPDWRAYNNTTGNTANQTLKIYKLETTTTPEPSADPPEEPTPTPTATPVPDITVTLNDRGATTTMTYSGTALELPTDLADVGAYKFAGWVAGTVTDGTSTRPDFVANPYTPTEDIMLYATYSLTESSGTATSYVLTSAANMEEGTYLIGALRSTTATDNFYFATGEISSGDMVVTTASTEISAVDGVRAISTKPEGAVEFTFTGNNATGYTISPNEGSTFLGVTSWSTNRRLAFSADYSNIAWTPTELTSALIAEGFYLVSTGNGEQYYKVGENATGTGAIRGYYTNQSVRAIYLFKLVSGATTTYTNSPSASTHTVTLTSGTGYTLAPIEGTTNVVNDNDSFFFTLTLAEGYTDSTPTVKANGTVVPFDADLGTYYIEHVTEDVTVTVENVVPNTYALSISITNPDYGTVTVTRGEDILADGAAITYGESLTISVDTGLAYKVTTFTVNGVNKSVTATETVSGNVAVIVEFAAKAVYRVSYKNLNADYGHEDVYEGGAATLPTGIASVGDYHFIGWMIDDGVGLNDSTTAPTLLTGSYEPEADITLVAVYKKTVGSGSENDYTLVTDAATLAANDKLIIVGGDAYAAGIITSASADEAYLPSVGISAPTNNVITIGSEAVDVFTLGGDSSGWTLTSKLYNLSIGYTSGNAVTYTQTGDAIKWTISIDENSQASIQNVATTARYLQYNSSAGRFAAYQTSSRQANPKLYKQGTGVAYYHTNPTLPEALTVTTLGMAARYDKTAVRFGGGVTFEALQSINVGDTVDYGFLINAYNGTSMAENWASRSAAGAAFTWTQAMEDAATAEELVAVIRATGTKVWKYDSANDRIEFAVIIRDSGTPSGFADIEWLARAYITVNGTQTRATLAKQNSCNKILSGIASGDYVPSTDVA